MKTCNCTQQQNRRPRRRLPKLVTRWLRPRGICQAGLATTALLRRGSLGERTQGRRSTSKQSAPSPANSREVFQARCKTFLYSEAGSEAEVGAASSTTVCCNHPKAQEEPGWGWTASACSPGRPTWPLHSPLCTLGPTSCFPSRSLKETSVQSAGKPRCQATMLSGKHVFLRH